MILISKGWQCDIPQKTANDVADFNFRSLAFKIFHRKQQMTLQILISEGWQCNLQQKIANGVADFNF
jgi:hypothetical protein